MINKKVVHVCDGCGREEDGEGLFRELAPQLGYKLNDGTRKKRKTRKHKAPKKPAQKKEKGKGSRPFSGRRGSVGRALAKREKKRLAEEEVLQEEAEPEGPIEQDQLLEHPEMSRVGFEKDVKCPAKGCDYRGSSIGGVYQHCWRDHHDLHINTATIRKYNEKSPTQQAHEEHVKALEQARANGGMYNCPVEGCNDKFQTKGGLDAHLEADHGQEAVEEGVSVDWDNVDERLERKRAFERGRR